MTPTAATNERSEVIKNGSAKNTSGGDSNSGNSPVNSSGNRGTSKKAAEGSSAFSYLGDSLRELKKVTFPSRAETRQATLVTLFIVFFVSLCLFLLDQVFFHLMSAVLG